MAYPIRVFLAGSNTWHDIIRFEIENDQIILVSTHDDKVFSLLDGTVKNLVVSPEVIIEMIEKMANTEKPKPTRKAKNMTAINIE